MDETTLALAIARGRLAFGVIGMAAPGIMVRAMSRSKRPQGAEAVFTRMWAARDLAMGLGVVVALDHGTPVRGWLEASATADASDFVAALLGREQLSDNAFKGTLALAGLSAVLNVVLSRRLDPAPAPHPGQVESIVTGHHEPA
jgi:hypothetical protein